MNNAGIRSETQGRPAGAMWIGGVFDAKKYHRHCIQMPCVNDESAPDGKHPMHRQTNDSCDDRNSGRVKHLGLTACSSPGSTDRQQDDIRRFQRVFRGKQDPAVVQACGGGVGRFR